jgi:hypothetical protein
MLAICSGQAMPSSEPILNYTNFGKALAAGSANLTLKDLNIQVKLVRDKILALCSGLAMPSSEAILNDAILAMPQQLAVPI